MSPKRWAISVFLVAHVTAALVGSISADRTGRPIGPPRNPQNNVLAAALTPVLDSTAAAVAPAREEFIRVTAPVQRLTRTYLAVTGLAENWRMFSGQLDIHQYLRVRYYVAQLGSDGKPGSAAWSATELVLPAHREDQIRLLNAYRDSARDKAMTIALSRFRRNLGEEAGRPDTTSAELPVDLAPIGRYFARRFQREVLRPDERIVRIETWFGWAPIPPQGTSPEPARGARLAVLREYYAGPIQLHFRTSEYPEYGAAETEADITWVLEYFEP